MELVLLTPVLALLTLFVLWAGRGGRAALITDLAAEEAATAAAVCCDDGPAGEMAREAVVEDLLLSRPGLDLLCVAGVRPDAGSTDGFVREHWLPLQQPDAQTGGMGVLYVQFVCETDGAVAPLRGLFTTVTFRGHAVEVLTHAP